MQSSRSKLELEKQEKMSRDTLVNITEALTQCIALDQPMSAVHNKCDKRHTHHRNHITKQSPIERIWVRI